MQAPQTANDGKTGHVQFAVPHDTGTCEIEAAMIPSYTAAFVESVNDVSGKS